MNIYDNNNLKNKINNQKIKIKFGLISKFPLLQVILKFSFILDIFLNNKGKRKRKRVLEIETGLHILIVEFHSSYLYDFRYEIYFF